MSRLTASPFHKPSPYDLPRPVHPLSPPETDSEAPGTFNSRPMILGAVESDFTSSQLPNQESPSAKFKRVSTLAYHNSAIRETRDRSIQRNFKSLVVVTPPEGITQQHGQLGHTLSSGPQAKVAQGILMPLFPTMYGQLTAIAREYNFPSVAGLCLYLQVSEGGITITPRISDESWPLLWGPLLDGSTPPRPHGLPIGGRIEFDIDVSKGRWYTSWLSSIHRDTVPATLHWRGDSRTSYTDDNVANEEQETFPPGQRTQNPSMANRHIPRKFSLADRYEVPSQHGPSKPASQAALSLPMDESQTIQVLPPVVQVDEPKTAKQILENRVNSWRASAASLGPIAFTAVAPVPSVDAPLDSASAESELNLKDFSWSVSSAGPPSDGPDSPSSVERLPSVHLDRRIEEDVCLTPSACTSPGPFDCDIHSPTVTASYLPSPDLGHRMIEDSPPTPLTATSWGPSSWPPTPVSDYRAPSVDLGARSGWSRPVTPFIYTSWGPGDCSYPPSPYISSFVHTPDVGQRTFDFDESATTARFSFPYYSAFESKPWGHVWPYGHDLFVKVASQQSSSGVLERCYPYLNIYPSVYPHIDIYPPTSGAALEVNETRPVSVALEVSYPALDLYPATYPNFNIYKPVAHPFPAENTQPIFMGNEKQISLSSTPGSKSSSYVGLGYPILNIYPVAYPYFDLYPRPACSPTITSDMEGLLLDSVNTSCSTSSESLLHARYEYPVLNIYPAVYPHFDLYPGLLVYKQESTSGLKPINISFDFVYPAFNLYPSVYPHFDIYNSTSIAEEECVVISALSEPLFELVRLIPGYPIFDLYPATYPHLEIYPPTVGKQSFTMSIVDHGAFATGRRVSFASTTTIISSSSAGSGTLSEQPASSIASRRPSPRTRGLPSSPAEGKQRIAGRLPSQLEQMSLEFVAGRLQPGKDATSTSNSLEFIAGTFNPRRRTLGQPSSPVTRTNSELLAGKYVPAGRNSPKISEFLSRKFTSQEHEHSGPRRSLEFVAGKFIPTGSNHSGEYLAGKFASSKVITPWREELGFHRSLDFVAGTFVPVNNYQHREPTEFLAGKLISKTGMPSIESLAGKLVAKNSLEFLAGRFVSQRPTVFGTRGSSTEFLAGQFVSVKGKIRGTTVPAIWTDQGRPAQVQEQGYILSGLPIASHARTRTSSVSTKAVFNSRPLPPLPVGSADASKRIPIPSHTNLAGSSTVSIRRHMSTALTLTTTPEIGSSIVQKDTGIARARSLTSKPPPPIIPRKPDILSKPSHIIPRRPDTLSKSSPTVPRKPDTSSKPPPVIPRKPDTLVARRSRVFDTGAPAEKPKPDTLHHLSMRTLG